MTTLENKIAEQFQNEMGYPVTSVSIEDGYAEIITGNSWNPNFSCKVTSKGIKKNSIRINR